MVIAAVATVHPIKPSFKDSYVSLVVQVGGLFGIKSYEVDMGSGLRKSV